MDPSPSTHLAIAQLQRNSLIKLVSDAGGHTAPVGRGVRLSVA